MPTATPQEVRIALKEYLAKQTIHPKVRAQIDAILKINPQDRTDYESQKMATIRIHALAPLCPWCDSQVGYFEAIPAEEAATYVLGNGCKDTFCPFCQRRIVETVLLVGGWHWRKHEDDKNPTRRRIE
jgi:hypothetical protein